MTAVSLNVDVKETVSIRQLGQTPYVLLLPTDPTDDGFDINIEVGGGVDEDLDVLAGFLDMTAGFLRQVVADGTVTVVE